MRFSASLLLFALCVVPNVLQAAPVTGTATPPTGTAENDYRLSVGDVIRVEVHDEEGLTLEAQVPATGTINYPFLGQIQAGGLTVAQLQTRITEGLRGDYLIKPQVRVRVIQYRPFFVRGQVKNAGGYPYVLGLTVEKAATLAGGFTDRASMKNIFVIRENTTQEQKAKVGLDSKVLPGDTIIVEESLF